MIRGDKDYYQILGTEKEASAKEIKEAYRKLALQHHPDRNKDNPSALEKMKEINEAYAVLSDPVKKREYEEFRERYGSWGYERFRQSYSEDDIFRGSDINQIFEEVARAFGFRGFEEIFKESYGSGYRTFEFRRPGMAGRGFIFFGPGFRRVNPTIPGEGGGALPGYTGRFAGYLLKRLLGLKSPQRGKDMMDAIQVDPQVAREGGKIDYRHWRKGKELVVTIPPGIREGQKIRLRGMGAGGKDGGEPGDLYLQVETKRTWAQKIRDFIKKGSRVPGSEGSRGNP